MVLRPFFWVFLICLLLSKCNLGSAVKDLKEKHPISSSSYISSLKSGYGMIEYEGKSFLSSCQVARRHESSYKPSYGMDGEEEKMARVESISNELVASKYKFGREEDEDEEKMARIESISNEAVASKYRFDHGEDEGEEKMAPLESISNEAIASKYKFSHGEDGDEEKMARIESISNEAIASKYKFGHGEDEDEEKMARIESVSNKAKFGHGEDEDKEEMERVESISNDIGSKYKPKYGVDEVEEKSSTPASSTRMEHHHSNHHHHIENLEHDNDIRSEDAGVFTIDDVLKFHAGRKLTTFFSIRKPDLYPGFLPREVADSIPFSSSETTKILQFFSVSPHSKKGKAFRQTIRKCEINLAEGETQICATSLESMLDFLKNAFGEADFKLISTTHPTMKTPILQNYTVLEPAREIESSRKVACHPLPYLYAVYMCHYDSTETKAFKVALLGDNGDKVNALIVCHMDTSVWSPKHFVFGLLGTKPGIPFCHTFTEGNVVWVQSSTPVVAM